MDENNDPTCPTNPVPIADVFACLVTVPLAAFPPMEQWKPISESDLRTSFRLAVSMEIDTLPQLKGKGKSTRLDKDLAVTLFADRVLEHLLAYNIVIRRGPMERSA